jgi:hypothetical protein
MCISPRETVLAGVGGGGGVRVEVGNGVMEGMVVLVGPGVEDGSSVAVGSWVGVASTGMIVGVDVAGGRISSRAALQPASSGKTTSKRRRCLFMDMERLQFLCREGVYYE